jgi:hypothetical protein
VNFNVYTVRGIQLQHGIREPIQDRLQDQRRVLDCSFVSEDGPSLNHFCEMFKKHVNENDRYCQN